MTGPELVTECQSKGVSLAVALSVDGPEDALTDDLVAALKVQKAEVVAHLLGLAVEASPLDPKAILAKSRGADPKQISWLLGVALLARRAAHAKDPEVKARLEALIRMTPRTPEGHEAFQRRMDEVVNALEAEGKLPPV